MSGNFSVFLRGCTHRRRRFKQCFFHRRRRPERLSERTSRTTVHALPVPDALGRANGATARRSAGERQTDVIDSRLSAEVEQSTYTINANY